MIFEIQRNLKNKPYKLLQHKIWKHDLAIIYDTHLISFDLQAKSAALLAKKNESFYNPKSYQTIEATPGILQECRGLIEAIKPEKKNIKIYRKDKDYKFFVVQAGTRFIKVDKDIIALQDITPDHFRWRKNIKTWNCQFNEDHYKMYVSYYKMISEGLMKELPFWQTYSNLTFYTRYLSWKIINAF